MPPSSPRGSSECGHPMRWGLHPTSSMGYPVIPSYISGWWLSHPSEEYELVGMIIPNVSKNRKCSKPPTRSGISPFFCVELYGPCSPHGKFMALSLLCFTQLLTFSLRVFQWFSWLQNLGQWFFREFSHVESHPESQLTSIYILPIPICMKFIELNVEIHAPSPPLKPTVQKLAARLVWFIL